MSLGAEDVCAQIYRSLAYWVQAECPKGAENEAGSVPCLNPEWGFGRLAHGMSPSAELSCRIGIGWGH